MRHKTERMYTENEVRQMKREMKLNFILTLIGAMTFSVIYTLDCVGWRESSTLMIILNKVVLPLIGPWMLIPIFKYLLYDRFEQKFNEQNEDEY